MLGRALTQSLPIAVIIPTYNRGLAVFSVLEKVRGCDPQPSEILVHIDSDPGDGVLPREIQRHFPDVRVLTSPTRLGCSGGRHRCLLACNMPYAVNLDDDSYPVDTDFFLQVEKLFHKHPQAAIVGAQVWDRTEPPIPRAETSVRVASYMGGAHAVRLAAYRQVRGLLPRPVGYGMEESDLSLQLFAAGWHIYKSGQLRVFHDTELKHHEAPEVTSGAITNVGLYAFLHYPPVWWGWGVLQVANKVIYNVQVGRIRGICSGILNIPADCYRNRRYRKPIPWRTIKSFLDFGKTGIYSGGDSI
jgi:GT2 family glycosyltransferase